MIFWRWLRDPEITCITRKLTGFEGTYDCIRLDELTPGGVDEVCAAFH